jgi:hypothetical protein
LPTGDGLIWLAVGMIASGGIYLAHAFGWWKMAPGGFGLESLMRSSWETVIAVGLSIGLIVAFRQLFDHSNRLLKVMVAASFGAYILHPAIIVALQTAIADVTPHSPSLPSSPHWGRPSRLALRMGPKGCQASEPR